MQAVQPQVPGYEERILAREQTEYVQLPAVFTEIESVPAVITRWKLSDDERAAIASGAVRLSVECPLEPIGEPS